MLSQQLRNINEADSLLTEQQAAALIGFTPRALQGWRCRGGGPIFVRISARAIRYRKCDLIVWIEAKLRSSTSDQGDRA